MSNTEKSLKQAFAGESQANRRYLFFADKIAKEYKGPLKDKLVKVFRETAYAETYHALRHFELMKYDITNYTKNTIVECIISAIKGESEEYRNMYPSMAKIAREEGQEQISDWFEILSKVERKHANQFRRIFTEYLQYADIKIYTDQSCTFCKYAKDLLNKLSCKFQEIDLTGKIKEREELMIQAKSRTVPQIFVDNICIGGFTELEEYTSISQDESLPEDLIRRESDI